MEFEQNGEDRAAYGEQLLKKLESRLNTKGLTERRFREFRRLYQVYPQLQSAVIQYLNSNAEIRRLATAEFKEPIRRLVTAKSSDVITPLSTAFYNSVVSWMIPADRLFNRLSSTHLTTISEIDNPVKRAFYEMETIRGCWSVKELERQIHSFPADGPACRFLADDDLFRIGSRRPFHMAQSGLVEAYAVVSRQYSVWNNIGCGPLGYLLDRRGFLKRKAESDGGGNA